LIAVAVFFPNGFPPSFRTKFLWEPFNLGSEHLTHFPFLSICFDHLGTASFNLTSSVLTQFAALIQPGSIRRRRTRYAIISDKVRRISERPAMADVSEEAVADKPAA
jgi:hypothetical protein